MRTDFTIILSEIHKISEPKRTPLHRAWIRWRNKFIPWFMWSY